MRDVTAQHRTQHALRAALRQQEQITEELQQVNRMKTTFLQAVSHELRTPLTSLLGFLANGPVTPDRQTADLGTLLEDPVTTMDLRDHRVHLNVDDGGFTSDIVLIGRALENLLGNAVHHTLAGPGVHVRVTRNDSGDRLEVTVEDEGPGLPDRIVGRVFEPFTQGPQAHTDPNPGISIGLTLTAQILAIHDGTLTAENRPEGGARLRLRLHDQTATVDTADHPDEVLTRP